jgi:hypothetical protein
VPGEPTTVRNEPGAAQLGFSSDPPDLYIGSAEDKFVVVVQFQLKSGAERGPFSSEEVAGDLPRARLPKPAGQVVLLHKVMDDWGFDDQQAATLLGFEGASDINKIYTGEKPVGHRDANDRLRAILRIATDLDALFRKPGAIRNWLSEPQRDLGGATPGSLLTEGSMENLLRVKYYVAYLSGRS